MVSDKAAAAVSSGFLFATCQVGAEGALKSEIRRRWPALRFAYSRPGFLTFKAPAALAADEPFALDCVFARAWAHSLGKATAHGVGARAREVWKLAAGVPCEAIHVWQRDMARPGWRGFEPHFTPAAVQIEAALRTHWPAGQGTREAAHPRIAQPGQRVLDCVLVEADEWWVGWHRATTNESCVPGGVFDIALPEHAVSRAYLKMAEALSWSDLPLARGERIAELGCAPGGASQALLDRGLHVVGIDPALVDPRVLAHPHFTHVQKRAADVRRREFRGVAWLAADMNIAPDSTLDAVEAIVTHPAVNVRGLLLTLKLLDWSLAEAVPDYLARVRRWGYTNVRARQLAFNRQEICVTALRAVTKRRKRAR
ncbi:MAG: SAM-dependent methyltransferase [Pirellulales bacterium]